MRYVIVRELAVGGMAQVLVARDTQEDALVVIKRMLPRLAEDADLVGMFESEAELSSRLEHPNIVRVLDRGRDQGRPFIVMEHLDGLDGGAVFAASKNGLPRQLLAYVVGCVSSALGYAHALGVVHRDVTPRNVFFTWDGEVKVLDFGIAKTRESVTRTATGVVRGKPGYLSPEQARGARVDARSDVFSLGVVAWELATARRLFARATEEATVAAALEPADPFGVVRPDLPRPLALALDRALAKVATQRPAAFVLASSMEAHGFASASFARRALATYLAELLRSGA